MYAPSVLSFPFVKDTTVAVGALVVALKNPYTPAYFVSEATLFPIVSLPTLPA